jgi:hypothetical protein
MKKVLGAAGSTRRLLVLGGALASIALVVFGIGTITVGALGINEVRDNLKSEQIYFGDASQDHAVPASLSGQQVTTGAEAREFAKVMRRHTLESTEGQVYASMGRFLDENGKPTSDPKLAATDPKTGAPVANEARNIWVTETALTTALNQAFFAERVAWFSIATGVIAILIGVGFAVLTFGALRREEEVAAAAPRAMPATTPQH